MKKILIKIGSQVLSNSEGINLEFINSLAEKISNLHRENYIFIIVSSGAISCGKTDLPATFSFDQNHIANLQGVSAIGQPILMDHYAKAFSPYDIRVAQVLLTHEDFRNKKRHLNSSAMLHYLIDNRVIPIINENDSIAFEEITVGDNDQLAAMVAQMLKIDEVIFYTGTHRLYTTNPTDPDAQKINSITYSDLVNNTHKIKTNKKSPLGRGGMKNKLSAIKKILACGIPVRLAGSKNQLDQILFKDDCTVFHPGSNKLDSKKERLQAMVKDSCDIIVDEGAFKAISKNSSVLPSGIVRIKGSFSRGDVVWLKYGRKRFAMGISEYSSKDIEKIKGLKSRDIESILGHCISTEVIHRNNLCLRDKNE